MPVAFGRLSSGFSLARRHPVLHTIRKHTGVDYAAPYGTEIFSVGHGIVQSVKTMGGYGRTVIIDHGDGYTTLYAHLSRYANIRPGMRVRQGQTIGYLGSSGLATGPHVHFEMRLKGRHLNPATIKLPKARTLAKAQRSQFKAKADELLTLMRLYQHTIPLDPVAPSSVATR